MPKNIHKELEKAILSLNNKEKDKLLLRLIAKNKLLVDQLQYTLLEDKSDLKNRVEDLRKKIKKQNFSHGPFVLLKTFWADIKHHGSVTKDGYSSVELMFLLLNTFLEKHHKDIDKSGVYFFKIVSWLKKREEMAKNALAKLDQEYHLDFEQTISNIEDLMPY